MHGFVFTVVGVSFLEAGSREEEAEARGRTVALGGAGGGNRGVFRSQLHHQERKDAESTPSPSGTSKIVLVMYPSDACLLFTTAAYLFTLCTDKRKLVP